MEADNRLKRRRLAYAIATHQAENLAVRKLEGHISKNARAANGNAEIFDREHDFVAG